MCKNNIIMVDLLISLSIFDNLDAASFFNWFIENASYLFVFIFMAVESSFIPFPSEVVVPPAVYIGLTTGNMNIFVIVIVATAGAIVGALVNYYLAYFLGRPIVYRFANSRFGHVCLIDEAKVKRSEDYFDKHGASSTFIGRLIPAVRQLISIPAGLAKMNIGKFVIFTGLGALTWNSILAGLGYWLSQIAPDIKTFQNMVEEYNSYLTLGGLILLVLCVLYIVYHATKKKSAKKNAQPVESDTDNQSSSNQKEQ